MNETTTARAAMKRAIISITTETRNLRTEAAASFALARQHRRASDEARADKASQLGHAAHWSAVGNARRARHLLLAYAFLRGRPLAALEGTRKRAPAPSADHIEELLVETGAVPARGAIEAWLKAAAPMGPQAAPNPTRAPAAAPAG